MEEIGMKEMSQKLRSIHNSWARSREIRICVNRVNMIVAHSGKLGPAGIAEELWC